MTAYNIALVLHNIVRWVVVLAGLAAAIKAIIGWTGQRSWHTADRQLGLLFTISMDLQVLIGLLLYLVLSPVTTSNFSNFGQAMGNADVRFFLVEHSVLMIVALVLAHVGSSRARKAATDIARHRTVAIFFTLALIVLIVAIPWTGRPLLRLG
jgi:hypothetical protein